MNRKRDEIKLPFSLANQRQHVTESKTDIEAGVFGTMLPVRTNRQT